MQLSNWRTDRAVKLSDENYPVWKVDLVFSQIDYHSHINIITDKIKSVVHWEYGNDRWFTANTTHGSEYSSTTNEDGDSFFNDGEFEDSQLLRSTVPIFSSRSKQGLGIGFINLDFIRFKFYQSMVIATFRNFAFGWLSKQFNYYTKFNIERDSAWQTKRTTTFTTTHNQKDNRIYSIFDKNYIPTV
ncbi:hypothetical protein ACTA71_011826 [Dictyostelium dimigraforme]